MSFSTDFQPLFHCTGNPHYDNIYSSYSEPPQDRVRAEAARLERSLVVPEFADSTPLDLFDRDGDATQFSGSLKGEFYRSRFPAFPFRSRFGWTRFYFLLGHLFYFLDHGL